MSLPVIPEYVLELVEQRLADRVHDRVQKRITGLYVAVAAALSAVGGWTFYDSAEDVRQAAIATAEDTVHAIVKEQVTPVADTARSRLDEASGIIMEARLQIERVDDALKRIVERATLAEEKAIETLTRTGLKLTEAAVELSALRDKVGGLHAETTDQLKALRDTSADLATISSLNEDVYSLARDVQSLIQHASGVSKLDKSQLVGLSSSRRKVAESIQERGIQLQNSGRLTVFFQFAGLSNDLARTISAQLRRKRYVVPGEVHETMDAETREVRYFRDDDLEQAQRLAADATAALAAVGLGDLLVKEKRMTDWRGAKPRPHTLELWLSVPEHIRAPELALSRS